MGSQNNAILEEIRNELESARSEAEPSPEIAQQNQYAEQEVQLASEGIAEYKALLVAVLNPAFAVFFPAWKVSNEEIEALADAYAAVLYKYYPDLNLGVEVTAIITTAMIILPRRNLPRKIPAEPEKQPEKTDDE